MRIGFSFGRLWAVIVKEFVQMRRDRLTFAMMLGIPLMQLLLFGYAINSDPKHLPTAIFSRDNGTFSRTLVSALRHSDYFDVLRTVDGEDEIRELLDTGVVQFVVHIPDGFSRDLIRGESPTLLLQADATDPAATGNAIAAIQFLADGVFDRDLRGVLADLRTPTPPVRLEIHRQYNEEGITQHNIVPGLMGVVLTMTMVIITALAVTRERERGTMENLLAMPTRPVEVIVGKLAPYILVGLVQASLILIAARFLFNVPMLGSLGMLMGLSLFFIAANLAVGLTFSTIARNQLQAMQMSFFFFLPSMLLSGFMFPFRGMPVWAQCLGEILPLTHFLRLVRGILLKGNGWNEAWPHVWPLGVFLLVALTVAVTRYRRTLD